LRIRAHISIFAFKFGQSTSQHQLWLQRRLDGFYLADNENPNSIKSNTVCNPSFIYLGLVLRGFPPLISSPQASTLGAAHNKVTSYQS